MGEKKSKRYLIFWLIPAVVAILIIRHFIHARYPQGHDSLVHFENAIPLAYLIKNAPLEILGYLRSIELHWPPLTYLVTATLYNVIQNQWAFHITNLLFVCAFLAFFFFTLRRLTDSLLLSLIGLLVMCANPYFVTTAISYNLEIGLLASIAFSYWVFIGKLYHKTYALAGLMGFACGLALLSKPVIALVIVFPLIGILVEAYSQIRKQPGYSIKGLLFLAMIGIVGLAWYGPKMGTFGGELASDMHTLSQNIHHPWWYHFKLILFDYAALPLLIGAAVCLPFVKWKQMPGVAFYFPASAGVALVFFSVIGTKREWFALGAYCLIVAFIILTFAYAKSRPRRFIVWPLLIVYSVLAIAVWFPSLTGLVTGLSLSSSKSPIDLKVKPYNYEEAFADSIVQQIKGSEPGGVTLINLSHKIRLSVLEMATGLKDPVFVVTGGFNKLFDKRDQIIPRSRFLVTIEKPGHTGPSFEALHKNPHHVLLPAKRHILENGLEQAQNQYAQVMRKQVDTLELAMYENKAPTQPWEVDLSPRNLLVTNQIAHMFRHKYYFETTRKIYYQGDISGALARYQRILDINSESNRTAALLGVLDCISLLDTKEKQAETISSLLKTYPDDPKATTKLVTHLYLLETKKEIRGKFVPAAEQLIKSLKIDDPVRQSTFFRLIKFLAANDRKEDANRKIQEEINSLPSANRSDYLWSYAEYASRQPALKKLSKPIFNAVIADEQIPEDRKNQARIWLLGNKEVGIEDKLKALPRTISTVEEAVLSSRMILDAAANSRMKGNPNGSIKIIDEYLGKLGICPVCKEELLIEKARSLIEIGDATKAADVLKTIEKDTDLKRIAKALLKTI